MSIKETMNLVYIDDEPEEAISCYLEEQYKNENVDVTYREKKFKVHEGYESLMNSEEVNNANVILIDSKLFENGNIQHKGKFSGEEFRMILRKIFPFIEVLVISQNGENLQYDIIPKYKRNDSESAEEYYERLLKGKIDECIRKVITFRNISEKLRSNDEIEKFLVEKTVDSLNGTSDYEDLTKEDIDRLIKAFRSIS